MPWLKKMPFVLRPRVTKTRAIRLHRIEGRRKSNMKTENVYSIITERICALLEKGTIPWAKPWANTSETRFPRNFVSNRPYRGINPFLLHSMSFESPYWLTFKQAQDLGGYVRKGEKGCPVVFWKWIQTDELDQNGRAKQIPFLRYFNCFNVLQCEGIPVPAVEQPKREHQPIQAAEAIIKNMPKPPEVRFGGDRACYIPAFDRIEMPKAEAFNSPEAFYSVLFHEEIHATGAASRLNRKSVSASEGELSAFGSEPYAKEELIAEMGASFLCGHAGIVQTTINNSAAYIAGWLETLRNDNRLILQAAAQAQKAADYILNVSPETNNTEESI